jgi:hypothetical protein
MRGAPEYKLAFVPMPPFLAPLLVKGYRTLVPVVCASV